MHVDLPRSANEGHRREVADVVALLYRADRHDSCPFFALVRAPPSGSFRIVGADSLCPLSLDLSCIFSPLLRASHGAILSAGLIRAGEGCGFAGGEDSRPAGRWRDFCPSSVSCC